MARTNFFAVSRTTAVSVTDLNKTPESGSELCEKKLTPTELCERNRL
jgi:hypothetical protein